MSKPLMTDAKPITRARGRASRISVSLHEALFKQLEDLACEEGRSLSNLCARLIETALQNQRRSP